jgi:Fusaric acid resistance protein-like
MHIRRCNLPIRYHRSLRRRIIGTLAGVPLAIACLPLAAHALLAIWLAAATAMVVYAIALPERYDIASGAYAFALIATMAASGEYPVASLLARLWETAVGGAQGVAVLLLITPIWRWAEGHNALKRDKLAPRKYSGMSPRTSEFRRPTTASRQNRPFVLYPRAAASPELDSSTAAEMAICKSLMPARTRRTLRRCSVS